ncbi:hypothetical protein [Vibrio intestinalis]|uniref:hypothetical protein n=1 Tax=Vibrio intestinalis TaxID=2933291 RepID=UPI0021A57A91|nr:hypothetical protein [Vibrio intestinalis]
MDQIEVLTEVRFTDVAMTQAEFEAMPVLNDVTVFELQSDGGSITSLDLQKLPQLQQLIVIDNPVLSTIQNLELAAPLTVLEVFNNPSLGQLDLTGLGQLEAFSYSKVPVEPILLTQSASNPLFSLNDLPSSANTTLTKLYLEGQENQITSAAQITRFTNLSDLGLNWYAVSSDVSVTNGIIDGLASKLKSLKLIGNGLNGNVNAELLTNIQTLSFRNNSKLTLTGIDHLSHTLTYLNLSYTSVDLLTTGTISQLTQLETLELDNIDESVNTNIDIVKGLLEGGNNHIIRLSVAENTLANVNLGNWPKLESLNLNSNNLLDLDLTQLPNSINSLDLGNTNTTNLTPIASLAAIKELNLSRLDVDSAINSILQTHKDTLETLDVSSAQVTRLDLAAMPSLTALNASSTLSLIEFHANELPNLSTLDISSNPYLLDLSLTSLPKLESLQARYITKVPSLTLTDMPLLESIDLHGNDSLSSLSIINMPLLNTLDASDNGALTKLTAKNLPKLATLKLQFNMNMTELDNSGLPSLETLDASTTSLAAIASVDFPELVTLNLVGADLPSLTLTDVPQLKTVFFSSSSHLIDLSITNAPRLENVALSGNSVQEQLTLDANCSATIDISYSNLSSKQAELEASYPNVTFR